MYRKTDTLSSGHTHTFQKGQALIKQGDVEQRLIVVLDGTVTVEQTVADTKVNHTSAYVSIRQHTSTYVSIRQHTLESSVTAEQSVAVAYADVCCSLY